MDTIRKERLLGELENRLRDARARTETLTDGQWEQMEDAGLEGMLQAMDVLSVMSPEYRQMREAMVLLHPYREAWKLIVPYRDEIMEADTSEQDTLLLNVLDRIVDGSRISSDRLRTHIYAFWPVPVNS